MSRRRIILLAAFTVFVFALLHPAAGVCARGPADLEAAGVGGSSPGHLSCGPDVRVRYAGAGGIASLHANEDPRSHQASGFMMGVGGAVEQVAMSPVHASDVSGIPRPYAEGALLARAGYDFPRVGVYGGAILFLARDSVAIPEVAFRIGRLDHFHMSLGFGSYDVPTLLRPGLWVGAAIPLGEGWELGLHGGLHADIGYSDDEWPARAQVSVRMPLTRTLWLQSSQAASFTSRRWGPESSLGVGGLL